MDSPIIRDRDSYLDFELVERVPTGVQGAGDVEMQVRVQQVAGESLFSGQANVWFEAEKTAKFFHDLRILEADRSGVAILQSSHPDELRLEIRVTDRAGHVAAIGQLGHWQLGSTVGRLWCVIPFDIPFDPSDLPKLIVRFDQIR